MQKFDISHEYNYDLWNEGVCDRKELEISWIYACLNPARQSVSRFLDLHQPNFQLSPFFILFFHLYDRSNYFLDRIIETADLPLSDARLKKLISEPITLNGNWDDFARIVEHRGLVPLHAMPGMGYHPHKTDFMLVLKNRLLYGAMELRDAFKEDIPAVRKKIIDDVVEILADRLGAPPETFNWNYKTKGGESKSLTDITPMDFALHCTDFFPDSYTVVFDEALRGRVTGKNCVFMPVNVMKELVTLQLRLHGQVVVGADTRQQSNRMLGILDTKFNDNASVFGSDIEMPKDRAIAYRVIEVTEYLSLDGVEVDTETLEPVRFKAQDSHGGDTGADGHYMMSADWFEKYVLFAVLFNPAVPDEYRKRK